MNHIKYALLAAIVLLMSVPSLLRAQSDGAILVYKAGGAVDTLSLSLIRDIHHSRYDVGGVLQNDDVTLRFTTVSGSEIVYPLTAIDSVITPKSRRMITFSGKASSAQAATSSQDSNVGQPFKYLWAKGDKIFLSNGLSCSNDNDGETALFTFASDSISADSYDVFYYGNGTDNNNHQFKILKEREQAVANDCSKLGQYGDAATAKAVRDSTGNYSFTLNHQTALLLLTSSVDSLKSLELDTIIVKAADGKNIAGTYNLSADGISLVNGTGTDEIKITTQTRKQDANTKKYGYVGLAIPNDAANAQDSTGLYVVIAPQSSNTTFNVLYNVYDTVLNRKAVVKGSPINIDAIKAGNVHTLYYKLPAWQLKGVKTDSVHCDMDEEHPAATLYGRVNFKPTEAGFVWGYNKDTLSLKDGEHVGCQKIEGEVNGTRLTLSPEALRDVDQRLYYFRAYAKEGNNVYYGAIGHFGRALRKVDFHLKSGLKWANINIGASTPADWGYRFNWGKSEATTDSLITTSSTVDSEIRKVTWDIAGDPRYDVATKRLRGCWRMPTRDDAKEMIAATNYSKDAVAFDNKTHRGSTYHFFPKDTAIKDTLTFSAFAWTVSATATTSRDDQLFWTSTPVSGTMAYSVQFNYGSLNTNHQATKGDWTMVRPVYESNCTLNGTDFFIRTDQVVNSTDSTAFKGTMRGMTGMTRNLQQGFVVGTTADVTSTSTDSLVLSISQTPSDNGPYYVRLDDGQKARLTDGATYYVRAFVTYDGETSYGAAVSFTK